MINKISRSSHKSYSEQRKLLSECNSFPIQFSYIEKIARESGGCTEKMVLLRQQNKGQQIIFLLLQRKISLQQPNDLLIELNIVLL